MRLYHYTTIHHGLQIIASELINTTASNLRIPKHLHLNAEGTAYVDEETDGFHPVVWLTSTPNAATPDLGSTDTPIESKTAVRIAVEKTKDMYPWAPWAKRHGIDRRFFEALKRNMPDWPNVYVCERPIPATEFAEIAMSVHWLRKDAEMYHGMLDIIPSIKDYSDDDTVIVSGLPR